MNTTTPTPPIDQLSNEQLVASYQTICQGLEQWETFKEQAKQELNRRWEAGLIAAKLNADGFTLSRVDGRVTYIYSAAVKAEEDLLKQHKKDEVDNGLATAKRGDAFWQLRKVKANA
jgi:hypothetical protein